MILMNEFCHRSTIVEFKNGTPGRARRALTLARRADRLPSFLGLRRDAEEVLDRLKVLIAGTGSVGATVALSLARMRIGELLLVDRGFFKPASLLTQPVGLASLGR